MNSRRLSRALVILVVLALALIGTVAVLLAPLKWGPNMWPFYAGAAVVLVWVAIDFLIQMRKRRGDPGDAPLDAFDTDTQVHDATEITGPQ